MADAKKAKKKLPKGRHLSQIKRQRQSIKRHERNVQVKSALKTAVKKVRVAVEQKDKTLAGELLFVASRSLQKAASKGIIHKRNAARRISRLAKLVHSLSIAS